MADTAPKGPDMSDLIKTTRELLDGVDDAESDSERYDAIQLAQATAVASIAESLARLADTFGPIAVALTRLAETAEHRAPSTEHRPAPKGYSCPACKHGITVHRMHGCDVDRCDCPQPFGRIPPGDPNPTT